MFARALATVSLAIVLVSCTSIVKVKDKDEKDVAGIPFYVKNEYFRHESVVRETWFRLTLTVQKKLADSKDGKESVLSTESFVIEVLNRNDDSVIALKKGILKGNTSSVKNAIRLIDQFQQIPQRAGKMTEKCIKNGIVSEWRVDDNRTYYLNAPLPWFGTGSLTQELNENGTLSKAISTADTKLAEAVASWIPLKEYLTGEFVEPATEAAKDPETKGLVTMGRHAIVGQGGTDDAASKKLAFILSLSIEETGIETTMTGEPVDFRPETTPVCLSLPATNVTFSQKSLEEKGKEEKKDDAPTIGISGSIKLPKPEGPKEAP